MAFQTAHTHTHVFRQRFVQAAYLLFRQCKNICIAVCVFSRKILWQFFWKMLESWIPYCSSRDKDMGDGNASSAPEQDHFSSLTPTQVVESDAESRRSQPNTPLVDAKKLNTKTPYVPKGWTLRQAQNYTHTCYLCHAYPIFGYLWVSWYINKCSYSSGDLKPRAPGTPVSWPCSSTWDELPKLVSIECAHLRQREGNWPHQHMCWRNGKRVTRMPWRSCWKRWTLTRTVNIILYMNHLG